MPVVEELAESRLVAHQSGDLTEITACRECTSRTAQDQRANRRVVLDARQSGPNAGQDTGIDRVELVRAVDGQGGHRRGDLEEDPSFTAVRDLLCEWQPQKFFGHRAKSPK